MKWFIIFLLFFFSGCKEDTQPELVCMESCIDCEDEQLKVVWQKELSPEFRECWSMTPIIHNNQVIFSDYLCGVPEKIRYQNGRTGEIIWEWEDYIIPRLIVGNNATFIKNDKLLFSTFGEIYAVDLNTGQTLWNSEVYKGDPRIAIIGDHIYHSRSSAIPDADTCYIRYSPVNEESWKTKLILTKKDGYGVSAESYALYLHPSQDSILIFQNRQYNFDIGDDKVDLAAYNLAQDTFLWYVEDLTPTGNSGVFTPIVTEGKIYFQGEGTIFCINALDGSVIWQQQTDNGYTGCPILLEEGRIIAKGLNREIHAFDATTGAILWHKEEMGANVENMAIHKGKIYYGSNGDGALRCLSLDTGKLLWIETSPNRAEFPNASFTSGVAINEDLGYLYVHDKYFAMCIDINE